MNTDEDMVWTCQYCGVQNTVWVDLTVDGKQDFIEDCRICCRPNHIIITTAKVEEEAYIEARPSDE
jgi:Cysteine-rich CPXCG